MDGYHRSMAGFETVCVAAVQATPVILDADATIDKAIDLLREAAEDGATLVVFPECFVSVYPSGAWAAQAATWSESCDELWERMWASSIDVRGPLVDRLTMAALSLAFISPSASTSAKMTGPARCTTRCWSSAARGCCTGIAS